MKEGIAFLAALIFAVSLVAALAPEARAVEWCPNPPTKKFEHRVDGCSLDIIKNIKIPGELGRFDPREFFREQCNDHDRNYHTCGNSKNCADSTFRFYMRHKCGEVFKGPDNNPPQAACKAVAEVMYQAVRTSFGQKSYDADQKYAGCRGPK